MRMIWGGGGGLNWGRWEKKYSQYFNAAGTGWNVHINLRHLLHFPSCTKQTGELLELSNQQLIDCSWPAGNHGCRGGFQDRTLRWVKRNGAALRRDYGPYLAQVSKLFIVGDNLDCRQSRHFKFDGEGTFSVTRFPIKHLKLKQLHFSLRKNVNGLKQKSRVE